MRNKSWTLDATRENYLPSTPATNNTNDDDEVTSSNLHSPPWDNSGLITLSSVSQKSTKMQWYFYCLWNYFIDYFDNTALGGAVIYAGDVPFQYNEQEGRYREFSCNPTGDVFLATSRDHELLSHKGHMSNILNNSVEPTKSNFVEDCINLMQITSPIPCDPSHPTYNA